MVPCCPSRGRLYTKMDEFARYTTKLSSSITLLYFSLVDVTSKLPSQEPLVVTPRLSPEGIKSEASAEEQAARAISAHAQCACLLSLQMGSIN